MSEAAGMEGAAPAESTAPAEAQTETAHEGGKSQAPAPGQAGKAAGGQSAAQIRQEVINELGDQDMDKLVTLKVNGKEEKMPLREALKISRMEKASQAKMQEAAQLRLQAERVINLAKTNPKAFFQQTGIDPYDFAEMTLAEKYNELQMTPEQKKLMEYEQKVKQYEEREKQEKMTLAQRQKMEAESRMRGDLEKDILDAWKESGLPAHKYFGARISAEMLSSHAQKRAGYTDQVLSAKEAASIVKQQVVSELQSILLSVAKTDPGAAQKMLGDELLKIFRDHDVKRVTGQSASKPSSQNRPAQAASGKQNANRPLTQKEWDEYFKKL